ncbi:MAG: alpha/beta hydrolase [Chthoniobacteraceae bacterium]
MLRRLTLALPFIVLGSIVAAEPEKPQRLDRNDLLAFHGSDGAVHHATTIADWQKRRAEILRGMQEVMGPLPGADKRCALDVKIEEEVDAGDHIRRKITYATEPGENGKPGGRAHAFLLIPKAALDGKEKFPAVLCLHGTDNVVGNRSIVEEGHRTNRGYALELARRGYVALAPAYPQLADYQPDLKALGYASGTMKAIWDNIRGLDLLDSLPFVKGGAYAVIGHSLGGHNSIFTAVFDERIKAVVSSCGLDSYLDYYGGKPELWEHGKGWCQDRYMPRLANYKGRLADIPFDFHELIGALAPRHVFISAPLGDSNFKWESVDRIAKAAAPVFKLCGTPENLRVVHPDGPHDFPPEIREQAYAWIDAVLKPR